MPNETFDLHYDHFVRQPKAITVNKGLHERDQNSKFSMFSGVPTKIKSEMQ